MKKFCKSLREDAKNIIDFEKKKMLLLTNQELESHQGATMPYICGKKSKKKLSESINYRKLEIIATIQVNIEAQDIVFVI